MDSLIIDTFSIPTYIRSDHQRLRLGSKEWKDFMKQELHTLAMFHKICLSQDITYSLIAGSLMAYYVIGKPFPWDDDIDIIMRPEDYQKLFNIFQSLPGTGHTYFHRIWICKQYQIDGENFWLGLHKYNPDWMKIFKNPGELDVGGIDFGFSWNKNGVFYESMNKNKICPELQITSTKEVFFGGITTCVVNAVIAEEYINSVYGTHWKQPVHPVFRGNKIQKKWHYFNTTLRYFLRHICLKKISKKLYLWHLRIWYFDYGKEQISFFLKDIWNTIRGR